MKRSFLDRPVSILGQSMPLAVIGLIAFAVVGSALLMFGARTGIPLLGLMPLSPLAVFTGQVWRLLTWAFFDIDGLNLVFGALLMSVCGRDLAAVWGGLRYLLVCAGIALTTGIITTLLGFAWRDVYASAYLSIWPLADALMIAWALMFPTRGILFMFVLPAAGRNLLYLTVGITVVFALMYGFANFVPHFLAMGLMYAYIRGGVIWRTQSRLSQVFSKRKDTRGLKVVGSGWNRNEKRPNGSGWVH
jgi:membrane associated rhomboid family serine protease